MNAQVSATNESADLWITGVTREDLARLDSVITRKNGALSEIGTMKIGRIEINLLRVFDEEDKK
jgi:hypothetical protein